MVIDITPEGAVQALHRDAFPLSFLGTMAVERASNIVFDPATQLWDIQLVGAGDDWPKEELSGFRGYDIARVVEVAWLDMLRLHGLDCNCDEARGRLVSMRAALLV